MTEEPPTALEETGHLWHHESHRSTNLTAEIALLISRGRSGNLHDLDTATKILAIPQIEEAISQWLASNDCDEREMRK